MQYANIQIDGEAVRVALPCSAYDLLMVADVDTEKHYIQRVINGKPSTAYRYLRFEALSVRDGDQFVTVYIGAATNG